MILFQRNVLRCLSIYGNVRTIVEKSNGRNGISCVAALQRCFGGSSPAKENKGPVAVPIPPKPKRPLTPYFKFMAKVREQVRRERPDAKLTDVVREIAHRWETVDVELKFKLEEEYKREQEVYSKERLNYDTKLTAEQKQAIKEEELEKSKNRRKRKHRKKCKENERPKRPSSAFILYLKSRLAQRGSEDFKQFQNTIATEWNQMSDAEKQPFMEEMNIQAKRYRKLMAEWETKMIQIGNTDLVRRNAVLEVTKPKKNV